jgi:hypothetical protein
MLASFVCAVGPGSSACSIASTRDLLRACSCPRSLCLPKSAAHARKVEGIGVEDGQVGVLAGCDGAGVLTDTETLCRRTGKHAQDAAPVTVGSRESPHAKLDKPWGLSRTNLNCRQASISDAGRSASGRSASKKRRTPRSRRRSGTKRRMTSRRLALMRLEPRNARCAVSALFL